MTHEFTRSLSALFAIAAQLLHWRPEEFWRSTPEELAMALANPAQSPAEPVTRQFMHQLMERERNG